MMDNYMKVILFLTLVLAAFLTAVSLAGAFDPATYARETASLAAQGRGQDLVNLFLVVPLLAISVLRMRKGSRIAQILLTGTVLYVFYSFVIYSFGIHFNHLFLCYCAVLGLSFYVLVWIIRGMSGQDFGKWFGSRMPARATGVFLLIIAVLFYMTWLRDTLPAVFNRTVPHSVSDNNLLVNPVHVMDMAVVLPGLMIAGIWLVRRQSPGYFLGPVLLVFIILMAVALAGMVLYSSVQGISGDASIASIFVVMAAAGGLFFILALKNMKT